MGRNHTNLHIKLKCDEKGTDDDCFSVLILSVCKCVILCCSFFLCLFAMDLNSELNHLMKEKESLIFEYANLFMQYKY